MKNTPNQSLITNDNSGFASYNLPEQLIERLNSLKFTIPTPIQNATIPAALNNRDIIGTAQTGTGKTLAFVLPILAKLLADPEQKALILVPTRELAMQILDCCKQVITDRSVKPILLIGGMSMFQQFQQLKTKPNLIIGTPGRIYDHLTQKKKMLSLDAVSTMVLDEADRMLDMGFSIQIDAIAKFLPANKQILMFSATMPENLLKLAKKYMVEPESIKMEATKLTKINLKESQIQVSEKNKYSTLVEELDKREGSMIIFANTKMNTERLWRQLKNDEFSVDYMHGDLKQRQRANIIKNFRNYKFKIIVATDVAARGLDIPHIDHVINYDIPICPEDYVHRIGRTARAGAEGEALSLISQQDSKRWFNVECFLDPEKKAKAKNAHKRGSGGSSRSRGRSASNSDNNFFKGKSEGRGSRGRSSEGRSFEGRSRPSEGRSSEGRSFEGRSRPSEGRSFEGRSRPSEGRSFEGRSRPSEGRSFEGRSRPSEGRSFEGRSRPSEGRSFEGRSRPSEGKSFEGRSKSAEGRSRPSEGKSRSFEGRTSKGRSFEGKSSEGRSSNRGEKRFSNSRSSSSTRSSNSARSSKPNSNNKYN